MVNFGLWKNRITNSINLMSSDIFQQIFNILRKYIKANKKHSLIINAESADFMKYNIYHYTKTLLKSRTEINPQVRPSNIPQTTSVR